MGSISPDIYRSKIKRIKNCINKWDNEIGKKANERGFSMPVLFIDEIATCYGESCEICGELQILLNGLKEYSRAKPEYEQMLCEVISYKEELYRILLKY